MLKLWKSHCLTALLCLRTPAPPKGRGGGGCILVGRNTIFKKIEIYIYIKINFYTFILIFIFIFNMLPFQTENGCPGDFSLIRLPIAHLANGSLSFVRLLTKKITTYVCKRIKRTKRNERTQWIEQTCPSMLFVLLGAIIWYLLFLNCCQLFFLSLCPFRS
jgi:hypothetical protein